MFRDKRPQLCVEEVEELSGKHRNLIDQYNLKVGRQLFSFRARPRATHAPLEVIVECGHANPGCAVNGCAANVRCCDACGCRYSYRSRKSTRKDVPKEGDDHLCNETLAHATRTSVEDVASVATSERHDSALVFVQFDVRLLRHRQPFFQILALPCTWRSLHTGRPTRLAILICHGLNANFASVVNTAIQRTIDSRFAVGSSLRRLCQRILTTNVVRGLG
mmetsp:Transcript_15252/g.46507  ORF Transcript_15252/g.46507 Transcript_15252/m.46507 type:complete len:220 (+) Transcript_15252:782-1441(+)